MVQWLLASGRDAPFHEMTRVIEIARDNASLQKTAVKWRHCRQAKGSKPPQCSAPGKKWLIASPQKLTGPEHSQISFSRSSGQMTLQVNDTQLPC
jgi:hypothetical protein